MIISIIPSKMLHLQGDAEISARDFCICKHIFWLKKTQFTLF